MFRTLTRRYVLSHLLPLMLTLPLMGIALIYGVDKLVLLPSVARELEGQAQLIADLARDEPSVFSDRVAAEAFVLRTHPLSAHLRLLDAGGHLLASNDPLDSDRLGEQLEIGVAQAQQGRESVTEYFSTYSQSDILAVVIPMTDEDDQVEGIVRLSYPVSLANERFLRLRDLVAVVLCLSLALGGGVGWILAVSQQRPLGDLRNAVEELAEGEHWERLPESGPEEIRLLLRAFNVLVDRLNMAEVSRRKLLANLVHELGRPLGALKSAVHALAGGADKDAHLGADLLAGMDDELERLSRLVDDLAGLHERVLGGIELNLSLVSLGEWLPRMLAPWEEAARRAQLQWRTELAPALPTLLVDSDRLAQALGNLLSNAIKYTHPGGVVTVRAGTADGAAWLRVEDTGPGMSYEEQLGIFEPFQRGRARGRFPQGMGLGLTIARDMTQAHGGRLEVESAPGQGSRFTIRLPGQTSPA
jgi:two-component system sensor histidine kinase BaeS